jgi:lipoprotein-releasing system ATP-binding protein
VSNSNGDTPIITVTGLRKSFPNGTERLVVLDRIDLTVPTGGVVSITGESGSGKSTLLALIGGLDTPDEGRISVAGMLIQGMSEAKLNHFRSATVGLIFQFHYLLRDFSALENVMLPALMQGCTRGAAQERGLELLNQVGLIERKNHLPPQLSGGERQRIAAARALVNDPPVILADEPTGNLDEGNSRKMEETLLRLAQENGKTLVIATHDPSLAAAAEFTYILERGCLTSR